MRSAFRRGVELLNEPESDSVKIRGQTAEASSKSTSEHMEGISRVPKNVTQLKPAIDKLMSKVITIAI
jgi:dihydrodipicolinate synthase/N-acetylneuraminate lyase